jgi:hypothetical protein
MWSNLIAITGDSMPNRVHFALATLLLTASVVPSHAVAQESPTPSTIIAAYVKAIGGKEAVMKITSYTKVGTLEVPTAGLSGTIELNAAQPDKLVAKTTLPGVGEILQGYNGSVGWDISPSAKPRVLADKELLRQKDGADFYSDLAYVGDRFTSMEMASDTTIGGESAYRIRMVRTATGAISTVYFSKATGLKLGILSSQETAMGPVPIVTWILEYRRSGGVLFATSTETLVASQRILTKYSSVTVNDVREDAFKAPVLITNMIAP